MGLFRLNRDHQGGRELSITRVAQQVFSRRKGKMGKQMKNLHFFNELLTEASAAGEERFVEVLVVDGDGLHQGGGEGQHLRLKQKNCLSWN